MSIVLDESYTSHASNEPQVSPSGSSEASVSQGTNLYHCRIQDQNPLGALAIAQMQVKLALAGTANPVKYKTRAQDKVLLGELVANISIKNHLPESFTILAAPEDRRPVQSDHQETIEPTVIHKSHTWEDVMNNIVKAGSGEVQVSADWLL